MKWSLKNYMESKMKKWLARIVLVLLAVAFIWTCWEGIAILLVIAIVFATAVGISLLLGVFATWLLHLAFED
jgi:uncharacterized membrane protein